MNATGTVSTALFPTFEKQLPQKYSWLLRRRPSSACLCKKSTDVAAVVAFTDHAAKPQHEEVGP
jgi:hypothetical protein